MRRKSFTTYNAILANGRPKETFHAECFAFMETHHDRLVKYARKLTFGDHEDAHDLCHHTFMILLQGGDNIDFTKSPCSYFYLMMKREKERDGRMVQRKFEGAFVKEWEHRKSPDDEILADLQVGDPTSYEEWSQSEREDTSFRDLALRFPELMTCLNPTERTHIEWYLDGLSYEDMRKKHPVSLVRIGQILTKARKKLKAKAEALLRDGS